VETEAIYSIVMTGHITSSIH